MRMITPRCALGLLCFVLAQSGISGCATLPQGSDSGSQLIAMSQAAGVQVHPQEVFTVSRGNETVTVAPKVGWEQVPATALPNGVDFAYGYFSTAELNVPRGYYTLRAIANPTGVGTVPARVQLIDRAGRVAAEIPAEIEIHSMTVPAEAALSRSFVSAIVSGRQQGIWLRCPNGQCIRLFILRNRIFEQRA
jgi:hypothetical protein